MDVPPGNRPAVPRDWFRGVPERYVAGGACPEPVEGTPEDARLPAPRAYSSERRTVISAVAVTPGRDEISGLRSSGPMSTRLQFYRSG